MVRVQSFLSLLLSVHTVFASLKRPDCVLLKRNEQNVIKLNNAARGSSLIKYAAYHFENLDSICRYLRKFEAKIQLHNETNAVSALADIILFLIDDEVEDCRQLYRSYSLLEATVLGQKLPDHLSIFHFALPPAYESLLGDGLARPGEGRSIDQSKTYLQEEIVALEETRSEVLEKIMVIRDTEFQSLSNEQLSRYEPMHEDDGIYEQYF